MNTKTIITIITALLLFIVLIFWIALRDKVKNISDKEPYSKLLNISMLTTKELVLAKNFPPFKVKELNIVSEHDLLDDRAKKIALLSKNTEVKFLKAYEYTNAISGFTKIVLVGDLEKDNQVYKFEYLLNVPLNSIKDFNLEPSSKEFLQKSVTVLGDAFIKK